MKEHSSPEHHHGMAVPSTSVSKTFLSDSVTLLHNNEGLILYILI